MSAQVLRNCKISTGVKAVLDAQWVEMRTGVFEQIEARKKQLALATAAACESMAALSIVQDATVAQAVALRAAKPVGLARVVPMVDVSGSMDGIPMHVAIGLGILVSEITHESFRDKILTFSEKPTWHDLTGETSFVDKVRSVAKAEWGMSTDFYAAMKRICDVVRKHKLGREEIPDLLVISDMQFDAAIGRRFDARGKPHDADLVQKRIRKMFSALGVELYGEPVNAPQVVFWNVRGSVGFPAGAGDKGVTMLSGYSPALMKFVLSGEMSEERVVGVDSAGKDVTERIQISASQTVNRVLDDAGLDAVRDALNAMPRDVFLE